MKKIKVSFFYIFLPLLVNSVKRFAPAFGYCYFWNKVVFESKITIKRLCFQADEELCL